MDIADLTTRERLDLLFFLNDRTKISHVLPPESKQEHFLLQKNLVLMIGYNIKKRKKKKTEKIDDQYVLVTKVKHTFVFLMI